jgi:hypothetical protein
VTSRLVRWTRTTQRRIVLSVSAVLVALVCAALIPVAVRTFDTATSAAPAGSPGWPQTTASGAPVPSAEPGVVPPEFARFQRWSDPATWGGKSPTAGGVVTISKGKQVLLDVDVPRFQGLIVDGDLALADRPVSLQVGYIMVHGGFWMGTERNPFRSAARIVLDGSPADDLKMGNVSMGANAFVAMGGGRIEIHGRQKGRTWTTLARTAEPGTTTLTTTDPVSWSAGDLIVVASSDLDVNHKERATVSSVSADGKTVTVNGALSQRHVSTVTSKTVGGVTRTVAERAELGLLGHNITITGPDNAAKNRFGGHIMVMAGGVLRLSDVALEYMGQIGKLGRYPIHWHFAGDAKSSLVENVSIRDSFNRMVTIHETDNVHVNGVVADETLGHGFFLEDGKETGNVITNNLVMGVRRVPSGQRIRKSDGVPSEFWISHPSNTFLNNSAAGGEGAGFWYDFNFNSDNTNIFDAINRPFGRNENSVAHSHKSHDVDFAQEASGAGISIEGLAGDVDRKGLMVNPTVWKNERFGIWVDGALTTENPMAANNGVGLNCQDTVVNGGLLLGNGTLNTGREQSHIGGLLRFYHGQCDVGGTWLANFEGTSGSSPEVAAIVDSSASSANFTNRVKALTFLGGGHRVLFASNSSYFDPKEINHTHWFADLDGSVVGDGKPVYITNNSALLRTSQDKTVYKRVGTDYFDGADFGTISPLNRGIVRVDFPDKVTITRTDGVLGDGDAPGLNMGQRYEISGSHDSIGGLHVNGSDPGYVDLVFTWTGRADPQATYGADGKKVEVKRASSLASLGVDGQFVVSGGKLYVRIKIDGAAIPFASGNTFTVTNRDQRWEIK